MKPSLIEKKKIIVKRAAQKKILDDVRKDPIVRDLNPDEQARLDALESDIGILKTRVTQLEAIEDDEDDIDQDINADDATDIDRSIQRGNGGGRLGNTIGDAPNVRTGDRKPYSILRALRLEADRKPLDGLELEVSQEIQRRKGGEAARSFWMPTGSNPEIRALMHHRKPDEVRREMAMRGGSPIRRDLTTSTAAGSIFNVPYDMTIIDLLRSKLVINRLGATMLTDMHGTFSMMRQSGKSTIYWLGEESGATASNPTYDNVPFTPKVAIDSVPISRQLLNQTSLDAEEEVKRDLSGSMAVEVDRVAINGAGSTQPLGLCQNSTIISNSTGLALGTNGGPMTYAAAIAMESQVANLNADFGSLAYLTHTSIRGELKQTPLIGSTFPTFVWGKGEEPGVGEVNTYRAFATTNVPSTLTKGSTSGTCKAVIFGNWSDLVLAEWEGVDVLVNPYTLQTQGGVIISMQVSMDVEVRHPESFSLILDAT